MAGVTEQQEEGAAGGSLEDFLAHAIADDGDDGDQGEQEIEAQGSSEGDQTQDEGDQEGTEDDDREEPVKDSRSRLVANLSRQEKALTGARSKIKELEAEVERLRESGNDPDDPVEMLRGRLARRMGLEPNDPAVDERLFEISQDLTVAHLGEAVDKDPELKSRRERLLQERKLRDERMQLERQKAELNKAQRDREIADDRRQAVSACAQMLQATPHPFLTAAVDDAADVVVDLALKAINEGQVAVPKTHEQGAQLLTMIAKNLESHHKARAQRLAKLLGQNSTNDLDTDMDTGARTGTASRKQGGARKRSAANGSTMGGGGRGRPEGRAQDDDSEGDEPLHEFVNRMVQRGQAQRRGVR